MENSSQNQTILKKLKPLGAWPEKSGTRFSVWAPHAKSVEVIGEKNKFPLDRKEDGYFEKLIPEMKSGDRYKFQLDKKTEIPDPASRFQPEGPHGASEIVVSDFAWTDQNWKSPYLDQWVIYELHIGTFSEEGTFAGAEKHLDHLKNMGITAIEIMPVAQFAGKRNWGYDGVGLFATQNSYGGKDSSPMALKHLINACHAKGIAVMLDVVYNHLGPEGNYLSQFGPYFQSKYKTPWGDALNYDGEWSNEVRNYFLQNARQWLEDFHFDGLRLDAIHAIFDTSAVPFLEDLSQMKRELEEKNKRPLFLIAESEANDSRILQPPSQGGLGLDGQWADDLHHVVHALVTEERHGYYEDYGSLQQLATAYRDGVVFHGEYSPFRHRSHGRSYEGVDHSRLVVCSQNHDQIGNRRDGERMISIVGPAKQRLAAACVLLSPALPLIFMGEELGETAPFQYFVDHTDKELLEAVRNGRKAEFAHFNWNGEPPDPAGEEAFHHSKIKWARIQNDPEAKKMMSYYQKLIELSKWIRKSRVLEAGAVETKVLEAQKIVSISGQKDGKRVQIYFSFSLEIQTLPANFAGAGLEIALDSAEDKDFSKTPLENSGVLKLKPFSAVLLRKG